MNRSAPTGGIAHPDYGLSALRIAHIGHKIVPSRQGGVEIVVEELATRFAAKGHHVDVYNRKQRSQKRLTHYYKGVNLLTSFTFDNKNLNALVYSFVATLTAVQEKYDIIHFHAEGPAAMIWLPSLLGFRTIATIHGLDWQRDKWGGLATKYIKFGEKVAAKYADEIIVLSPVMQTYFKTTYGRDTTFIPNGVNEPIYRAPNLITKYGLRKDGYILFLARIVPEKGLHKLLTAFKQVDTGIKLVVAGSSAYTNEYYSLITKLANEDSRVILTGHVEGQELQELFTNCLFYCLPSDVEGMPISLLEAMSYGRQCLISDIPESTQVAGQYATTFKRGNVSDLAEKLKAKIGTNSNFTPEDISSFVLQNYNWDKIASATEKLYRGEYAYSSS